MSDNVILTTEYWDCECEGNYIHHKSTKHCDSCHSFQKDQPNSRLDEVINFLFTTIT